MLQRVRKRAAGVEKESHMKKIAVLVGSLREQSYNKNLAKSLERAAAGELEFCYVDMNMPLFNQDLEAEPPESVVKDREIVAGADGVLLVTPEYSRSTTGVMKNALDWLSRPYAQGVILRKKVGIVGASPSPTATAAAQVSLRNIIGNLNMHLMGQPEFYLSVTNETFDADGFVVDTSFVNKYISAFCQFVS